jgi:sulfotransferase family protein
LKRAEERPDEFVRVRAVTYLRDIRHTKQAYEAHEGRKALVRYEDLRADTMGEMKRLYAALEIPVDEEGLARAVEKCAWENVPEDKKGPGTVRRRGTSGGWREDLTPKQAEIVERITAPILEEFYG